MTRPIRLFEEDPPEARRPRKLVRDIGLAAAAPVLAYGLCPAHEEREKHLLDEMYRPLPAVSRLAISVVTSASSTPFFRSDNDANDVVIRRQYERRFMQARVAMTSSGSTSSGILPLSESGVLSLS